MTIARRRLSAVSFLALFAAACSTSAPPATITSAGSKRVDVATAGSVTGRVVFEGTPPPAEPIMMGTDQSCLQGNQNPVSDAVLVAADGGLRNVFVHIKSGLDQEYAFDIPKTPALLDQKGCVYVPRVLGVMAGQEIEILNSDGTMHNVHAIPTVNQEFNKSTPVRGFRLKEVFTAPEVAVRFMCNVHNWMAAHVGVVSHPFFAVTDASGNFSMNDVPPGTYTIQAWHEKFGTREQTITIGAKQNGTLAFKFTATQ